MSLAAPLRWVRLFHRQSGAEKMILSASKIALIALVVFVLFKGKDIPKMLGELGKGISNFKKGLADRDTVDAPRQIEETR
jgi:TatA/E family protein of Tat protein translocase